MTNTKKKITKPITPTILDKNNLKKYKKTTKQLKHNTNSQKKVGHTPKSKTVMASEKVVNKNVSKSLKKNTHQKGGSDICSRDINELLAGNPIVVMGNKKGDVNFSKEMSAAGKSFSKDVMSSFSGIEDGWGGSPGMPPKFPSGCVLM